MISIGSLYSGIGGLEVGVLAAFAEAGIPARVRWQVEFEPFCQAVLSQHFPGCRRYGDVESVHHPEPVDLLVGGFACQDVSAAGEGRGLGRETRSGNTRHHFTRIIGETRPRAIIVENVASGAQRWIPRIVQDLRAAGYRPHAVPLGAVHVGAPHRRLRVLIVALRETLADSSRLQGGLPVRAETGAAPGSGTLAHHHHHHQRFESLRGSGVLDVIGAPSGDDPDGRGRADGRDVSDPQQQQLRDESGRSCGESRPGEGVSADDGQEGELCSGNSRWPAESGVGQCVDGLPFDVAGHLFPAGRGEEQYLWEPPRAVAAEVKIANRPEKLKALGNAVVPQCALVVGRVLLSMGFR